jgi:hypothetical protein
MTHRRQPKRKEQAKPRTIQTAPDTTKKERSQRKNHVGPWVAGVLAAVIAALAPVWWSDLAQAVEGWFPSTTPGSPLTVTAEPTFLDDQGYRMATPVGARSCSV